MKKLFLGVITLVLALLVCGIITVTQLFSKTEILVDGWTHLSTVNNNLSVPGESIQQTASLIFDVDKDGLNDFIIGSRQGSPSLVWYQRNVDGWTKYLIDDDSLDIEAGGAFYDIDGDGDIDVVMGGDYQSNKMWWWENPYPNFDPNTAWVRREIKSSGNNIHHDQMFGDFDGDGQAELVFWNQVTWDPNNTKSGIYIAQIPSDPTVDRPWSYTKIYTGFGEGLAQADIDGDGKLDIIGGGHWFKHTGGTNYLATVIDPDQQSSRVAVGQLKAGGRPEIVFVTGDGVGRLKWYECTGDPTQTGCWIGHDLLNSDVDHGHSLQIADVNGDKNLDIFAAEMRLDGDNADAKMWLFAGDGQGNFTPTLMATGYGNHETKIGDLDGDTDLDILGKPYNWDTPRLDIWLNQSCETLLDRWDRHVVDNAKPWQSIFLASADIDGDGKKDIITGGWWYKNPGSQGSIWTRNTIGQPLNNIAAVYDFDGDGDIDILGTEGRASIGSTPNSESFVWARNDGAGSFTIFDNIDDGNGDFLQGVAVGKFQNDETLKVALSWHAPDKGVQLLTVPANPASGTWVHSELSSTSQDEALSTGDIDRDGDLDILLGTRWLRNDGTSWSAQTLNDTEGDPDRNRLVDINGDGRLDAVVGFEAISKPGKLAWYEQPTSIGSSWTEHLIANTIGPMSLDVADMDKDGDMDVVVGEHNIAKPADAKMYVFENLDGHGNHWQAHVVYTGDEHHDGAQVVDIDGDGDLDIISIGWGHDKVLLYENKAMPCPATQQP